MDYKVIATVFVTVFLAELGDKTQLATMLFAADGSVSRWAVFLGASLALITTSGFGVLAGSALSGFLDPVYVRYAAGTGFIVIGLWTLLAT